MVHTKELFDYLIKHGGGSSDSNNKSKNEPWIEYWPTD